MNEPLTVDLKYLIDDYNDYFKNGELPDLTTSKGRKQAQIAFDNIISKRRGNNYASSKEYVNLLKNDNYINKTVELYNKLITTNDLDETERKFLSGALKIKEVRTYLSNIFPSKQDIAEDPFLDTREKLTNKFNTNPQELQHPRLLMQTLDLSPKVDTAKLEYVRNLNTLKKVKNSSKKSSVNLGDKEYFPERARYYDTSWVEVPDLKTRATRETIGIYINQKKQDIAKERNTRMLLYLPTDDLDAEEKRVDNIANRYYQGHDGNDFSPVTEKDYRYLAMNSRHKKTLDIEYRKRALKEMQERLALGKMTQQEYKDIILYWKDNNLTLGTDTYTQSEYRNLFN